MIDITVYMASSHLEQTIFKGKSDAQYRAAVNGGIRGLVGGAAIALPSSYLLRRWAYYRHLPPSLKALGMIMVVVPSFVISAEQAGLRYERAHW